MRTLITLMLISLIGGCVVEERVAVRRAPCPGGVWIEGHYGPRGAWHPGHWQCPGGVVVLAP
jgi:hypothetical protein